MSLPATFRPRAEADLVDAFAWYEERLPGLGEAFLHAVDASLASIQRHPEAYPEPHPRVRRASLRRFPYGVFYVVRDDRIDVLAGYHARRSPRRFAGDGFASLPPRPLAFCSIGFNDVSDRDRPTPAPQPPYSLCAVSRTRLTPRKKS